MIYLFLNRLFLDVKIQNHKYKYLIWPKFILHFTVWMYPADFSFYQTGPAVSTVLKSYQVKDLVPLKFTQRPFKSMFCRFYDKFLIGRFRIATHG